MSRETFIIVVAILSLLVPFSTAEDVILGRRIPGDRLLQKSRLYDSKADPDGPAVLWKVLVGDGSSKISQLVIRDQALQVCGLVVPVNGGPGFNFVALQLVSQPKDPSGYVCSSDYAVEMYGL